MAKEDNLTPWKPGQSGNPAGLPKGTKWLKTRLREALEATGADKDIVLALIEKAKKGDIMAIKEVLDRIDGKVAQEVEQKSELSGQITVKWDPTLLPKSPTELPQQE